MSAESGGHYCDPLFALMLVYNAIKGNYTVPTDGMYEILFPYLYVASSDDYAAYAKLFVDSLPYTADELKAMQQELLNRHYQRKHGRNAYYGQ